jgi:adenylylsulfate kinase-like enzyme
VAGVVVLLGAPGSGKSTVGAALERRGLRWREWEMTILDRWGSRDNFLAHKTEALPELHELIRRWIAVPGAPAVLETTGLSDAPLLRELSKTALLLTVRLNVSESEAVRRVAARESGRHLTDDTDANRRVWRLVNELDAPLEVDVEIDTEASTVEQAVDAITDALARRSQ